eukprot:TRINITY_DN1510_c0_g1_i17.p1 TRINITY_DN1510_c0_g1~~TRINITY_DN1510_c0_g1_i17.p1  ORF type:complete len:100 (-),score=3.85 TRINITY_DN1510_c0_g1_i17:363-662(-)
MKSAPHQYRALSVQYSIGQREEVRRACFLPFEAGGDAAIYVFFTPSSANQATCTDLGACHGKTRDANRYFAVQLLYGDHPDGMGAPTRSLPTRCRLPQS